MGKYNGTVEETMFRKEGRYGPPNVQLCRARTWDDINIT